MKYSIRMTAEKIQMVKAGGKRDNSSAIVIGNLLCVDYGRGQLKSTLSLRGPNCIEKWHVWRIKTLPLLRCRIGSWAKNRVFGDKENKSHEEP